MDNKGTQMEALVERFKSFYTKEGLEYGQTFTPRPTDVFIDTYGKAGTTWVQTICHSLRSNGSMDFDDITTVCPWDVVALDIGQDLNADQGYEPRIFKSHEPWPKIAKANPSCKYIHVARDPVDVFVSFLNFIPGWLGVKKEDISMEEFCDVIFANAQNSGNIAQFYLEWFNAWKHQSGESILWIFFEDMKNDLPGEIRKIAKLMNIRLTDDLLDVCLNACSFETMSKNKSKFKDNLMFEKVKDRLGLSHLEEPGASKVRSGKVGGSKEVPKHVFEKINEMWKKTITPELGFASYSEMKDFVNKAQNNQA